MDDSLVAYRFKRGQRNEGVSAPAGRGGSRPAPVGTAARAGATRARSCPCSYRSSQYDSVSRSSRLASRARARAERSDGDQERPRRSSSH